MKHNVLSLAGYILVAAIAIPTWAQSNFDEEVNAELDRMYQTKSGAGSAAANGSSATVQVNVKSASPQGPVQKQPTTVIEASPLVESRAERVRRERQEAELATEQKIVEKLEQSRIDDEKRRMDKVFGERLDNMDRPVVPVVPVQAPVQAVVVAPIEEKKETPPEEPTLYMGVVVGTPGYADVPNVRANYSAGILVGKDLSEHLTFEGSLVFSNYEIRQRDGVMYFGAFYPRLTSMDQIQGLIALKGVFLEGSRFRPNGGIVVGYSFRSYRDTRIAVDNNKADSQALDWGLTAGFDVELTKKFALGLDIRYLWNLTSRSSADNLVRPFGQLTNSNPLERLNYYQLLLAGKYYF